MNTNTGDLTAYQRAVVVIDWWAANPLIDDYEQDVRNSEGWPTTLGCAVEEIMRLTPDDEPDRMVALESYAIGFAAAAETFLAYLKSVGNDATGTEAQHQASASVQVGVTARWLLGELVRVRS